jgi:hypothetical protein
VIKWSQTCRRVGRGTFASGGRPEQWRKLSAAVYVYPAPPCTSTPGRRRLHRRPNLSRPAAMPSLASSPSFESLPESAPSSRCAPVCRRSPHEQPPNHAFSVEAWHRGDPMPSLQDVFVQAPLRCARCRSGRGTPHDAPPCRMPGVTSCVVPLCSGLRAMMVLCRGLHTRAVAMRTPTPKVTAAQRRCPFALTCDAAASRCGALLAVPCVSAKSAFAPCGLFLQVRACARPGPCAPQRQGPGSTTLLHTHGGVRRRCVLVPSSARRAIVLANRPLSRACLSG